MLIEITIFMFYMTTIVLHNSILCISHDDIATASTTEFHLCHFSIKIRSEMRDRERDREKKEEDIVKIECNLLWQCCWTEWSTFASETSPYINDERKRERKREKERKSTSQDELFIGKHSNRSIHLRFDRSVKNDAYL